MMGRSHVLIGVATTGTLMAAGASLLGGLLLLGPQSAAWRQI